ncbi:endoplasmic reticulum vesicle transporter-domain-containing protein [Phanerochaete sordida]|uniref:Endoplasmic reticulum vesicle transporter-domain-containing protein n=1 Tax=Phanerochaete sordida TaxID=48140 RepID=A0A9P3L8K8_9APHY|nr:endoplasmic reticulum vesicle transporter-domain-containing protein [Phanerochaete sordida]
MDRSESPSLLDKLDTMVPTLAEFDAFPKLPTTYKARSESRGFLTVFVTFMAFLLVLNDLGEFIWGWPDYEFSVDRDQSSDLRVNVDMLVNMPCQYLSVDLRDAVGDRLYLSSSFRRDGTLFDIGQATALKEHAASLSARQAVAQSRKSRGLFATLFRRNSDGFRPTYNYKPGASACRVYGTVAVKKVTANLHITTLGHGYASHQHVDHNLMNLSHVITEFSFGPYFPDMTQPLDNSFELTEDPFVSYQYFLHVVPTSYIAPRSRPLNTHQYSVTHYTRVLDHNKGIPGIFFKFDVDPMSLTIHQRTTSLLQLLIRCVGVVGGVFVCMGYAVRITTHAVEAVTGADKTQGIVAAEATGAGRKKWIGGELRSRVSRQSGGGWTTDGGSPYGSYAGTPVSGGGFSNVGSPYLSPNPYGASSPAPGAPQAGYGLGLGSPSFGPGGSPRAPPGSIPTAATAGSPYAAPPSPYTPAGTPPTTAGLYAHFPPTPNGQEGANGNGYPHSPGQGPSPFSAQQGAGAPPRRENGVRHAMNGSLGATKKDD